MATGFYLYYSCMIADIKEGNIIFNDTFNTFIYGYMAYEICLAWFMMHIIG